MWKPIAGCVAAAMLLTTVASLILPKRYTATASLMIELPGGSDPRAVAALSPVYLESLKSYEHFASSDTIFLAAIDRLGIHSRFPGKSVEALKRSMLRISKPASTRVLEISATLDNPQMAARLARYIAQGTVDLNRSIETRSAQDVASDAESIFKAALERLERADNARDDFSKAHQIEAMAGSIDNMIELRFDLQRDLQESKSNLKELEARAAAGESETEEIAGARARILAIEQQDEAIGKKIEQTAVTVETLKVRREELDAEQKAARSEAEASKIKWNDARASLASQGERVSILDLGIVPERPSFPNLPLNIAVAFVLSLVGSLIWIAWRYTDGRSGQHIARRTPEAEREYSLAD